MDTSTEAASQNSYARGFVSGLKYIDGLVGYHGLAGQAVEGYLDDENKNRILFSPPANAASGEYRITVTATYPNDRTSSASFVLNVVEPKAVITTLTETSTLSTAATWSAESSSGVGLRYQWTWDKKPDRARNNTSLLQAFDPVRDYSSPNGRWTVAAAYSLTTAYAKTASSPYLMYLTPTAKLQRHRQRWLWRQPGMQAVQFVSSNKFRTAFLILRLARPT